MARLPLLPGEARALIEAAATADLDMGPGRDFYYVVEIPSGASVEGLIAEQDDAGVTLADVHGDNSHQTVGWDAIRSVSITSYT